MSSYAVVQVKKLKHISVHPSPIPASQQLFQKCLRRKAEPVIHLRQTWASNVFTALPIGEGKRRNEFAEWHVAWPAECHNYAKYDICGE